MKFTDGLSYSVCQELFPNVGGLLERMYSGIVIAEQHSQSVCPVESHLTCQPVLARLRQQPNLNLSQASPPSSPGQRKL